MLRIVQYFRESAAQRGTIPTEFGFGRSPETVSDWDEFATAVRRMVIDGGSPACGIAWLRGQQDWDRAVALLREDQPGACFYPVLFATEDGWRGAAPDALGEFDPCPIVCPRRNWFDDARMAECFMPRVGMLAPLGVVRATRALSDLGLEAQGAPGLEGFLSQSAPALQRLGIDAVDVILETAEKDEATWAAVDFVPGPPAPAALQEPIPIPFLFRGDRVGRVVLRYGVRWRWAVELAETVALTIGAVAGELAVRQVLLSWLVGAIANKDSYTSDHCRGTRAAARIIRAQTESAMPQLKPLLDPYLVDMAALLHDVGKVRIPASLLCKQGPLSEEEFAALFSHPRTTESGVEELTIGGEWSTIRKFPFVRRLLRAITEHHRPSDADAFLAHAKKEEVAAGEALCQQRDPLGQARFRSREAKWRAYQREAVRWRDAGEREQVSEIVAVADTFHALAGPRPYRMSAMKTEKIAKILHEDSRTRLAPEIVDVVLGQPCWDELLRLREEWEQESGE